MKQKRLLAGEAVYSSRHPLYDLRTGKTVLDGDTCQMLKGARHPPHAPYVKGAWLRQLRKNQSVIRNLEIAIDIGCENQLISVSLMRLPQIGLDKT